EPPRQGKFLDIPQRATLDGLRTGRVRKIAHLIRRQPAIVVPPDGKNAKLLQELATSIDAPHTIGDITSAQNLRRSCSTQLDERLLEQHFFSMYVAQQADASFERFTHDVAPLAGQARK